MVFFPMRSLYFIPGSSLLCRGSFLAFELAFVACLNCFQNSSKCSLCTSLGRNPHLYQSLKEIPLSFMRFQWIVSVHMANKPKGTEGECLAKGNLCWKLLYWLVTHIKDRVRIVSAHYVYGSYILSISFSGNIHRSVRHFCQQALLTRL